MKETLYINEYQSPIGLLVLAASDRGLIICAGKNYVQEHNLIEKKAGKLNLAINFTRTNDILQQAKEWLDGYFSGVQTKKEPPLLTSGSSFQNKVWHKLTEISYGTTTTYSETAKAIGSPKAVRATANTIGANPLWIFAPCHRVIGTNGQLTGYAGGLDAKKYLLDLEAKFK